MYIVIRNFHDLTNNNRFYAVGDIFPADGAKASKTRINALLTGQNANGKVYIREEAEASSVDEDPSIDEDPAEEDEE